MHIEAIYLLTICLAKACSIITTTMDSLGWDNLTCQYDNFLLTDECYNNTLSSDMVEMLIDPSTTDSINNTMNKLASVDSTLDRSGSSITWVDDLSSQLCSPLPSITITNFPDSFKFSSEDMSQSSSNPEPTYCGKRSSCSSSAKRLKLDKNCYEPDAEAIAQVKEMIYRAAAMRPVNIVGVEEGVMEKPKRKNVRISSDPQTVAARHRRERISDRLRVLQKLVPGGSRMNTASMLDEAANYIKFLKSEVRTLETLETITTTSTAAAATTRFNPPPTTNFPMETFFSQTKTTLMTQMGKGPYH